MTRRVRCRYHCAECHAHFSSANAFDAHRAGDHSEGRYCLDPIDDPRFEAITEHGACAMYEIPVVGVSIWTLADDLKRARERFGGGTESSSGPRTRHPDSGGLLDLPPERRAA